MRSLFLAFLVLAAPALASEPSPAPPAFQAQVVDATDVVSLAPFQPTWAFALRAGAALPLGKQAADNAAGGMTGLDVFFQATSKIDIDLLALYAEMPYTAAGGGSSSPLTESGPAVKLDFQVYKGDDSKAWVGAGVGYLDQQSTGHFLQQPVAYPITYVDVPQNNAGLALLGCAGMDYAFNPQWSLNLELLVLSLDAGGGTSNNVLAALPDLFVKWTY